MAYFMGLTYSHIIDAVVLRRGRHRAPTPWRRRRRLDEAAAHRVKGRPGRLPRSQEAQRKVPTLTGRPHKGALDRISRAVWQPKRTGLGQGSSRVFPRLPFLIGDLADNKLC
jgi:hypothetical protein